MSGLRILYVTTVDVSRESGPMLHVMATVRELQALGVDVRLIHPLSKKRKTATHTASITRGVMRRDSRPMIGMLARRRVYQAVQDQIVIERPDLVYMRGNLPRCAAMVRRKGIPVVVEYNGDLLSELHAAGVPYFRRRFEMLREAGVAKHSAVHGVCVDESVREALQRRYPDFPLSVVPNGCEADTFRVDDARLVGGERLRLVFVGALQPWTDLASALHALQTQLRRYTLDVIGDGPRLEQFMADAKERGIAERVNFRGRVPHTWLRENLCRYDIGLNLDELGRRNSPLKVPEYLAAGLAVVGTGTKSLEYLRSEGLGAYCEGMLKPGVLSTMILSCSGENMHTPIARGERAAYARKELSWRKSAEGVLAVLQKVKAEQ